jgi:hypothetical protein
MKAMAPVLVRAFLRPGSAQARGSLWALLMVLVAGMLATLMWLAGRYESSQVQSRLERDTADAVSEIRSALTRDVQSLQALHAGNPTPESWLQDAQQLLREHREFMRVEWRDPTCTSSRRRTRRFVRRCSRGSDAMHRSPTYRWPAPRPGACPAPPIPPAISCRNWTGSASR